jgi:hypothetical protein
MFHPTVQFSFIYIRPIVLFEYLEHQKHIACFISNGICDDKRAGGAATRTNCGAERSITRATTTTTICTASLPATC